MRIELLYNPRLLCERLAAESISRRRLAKLHNAPASRLSLGHIGSLELIELAARYGVKIIYDIGANVGTRPLLAKSIIPDAIVHAFEPLPKHHDRFVREVTGVDNIILHRVLLGSENASAKKFM